MTWTTHNAGCGLSKADGATAVSGGYVAWLSFVGFVLCVVLGVTATYTRGGMPGILLIITALPLVMAAEGAATPYAALALIGGVLAALPVRQRAIITPIAPGSHRVTPRAYPPLVDRPQPAEHPARFNPR